MTGLRPGRFLVAPSTRPSSYPGLRSDSGWPACTLSRWAATERGGSTDAWHRAFPLWRRRSAREVERPLDVSTGQRARTSSHHQPSTAQRGNEGARRSALNPGRWHSRPRLRWHPGHSPSPGPPVAPVSLRRPDHQVTRRGSRCYALRARPGYGQEPARQSGAVGTPQPDPPGPAMECPQRLSDDRTHSESLDGLHPHPLVRSTRNRRPIVRPERPSWTGTTVMDECFSGGAAWAAGPGPGGEKN